MQPSDQQPRSQTEENQKALQRIIPGRPETYGGVVKGKQKTFLLHTLPDVAYNARIVAICGIESNDAAPDDDGWFLSDFFLFHHLLEGCGSSQKWLVSHGMLPHELLDRFRKDWGPSPYLHGNPFETRKIVLSDEILRKHAMTDIKSFKQESIRDDFLNVLQSECATARRNNETVLVLIFAHGERKTFEVHLGDRLLTMDCFEKAIGTETSVTLLTTACFSGGWAVRNNTRLSVLAAADYNQESESWNESPSVRRQSGGIYTSAVLNALLSYGSPLLKENEKVDEPHWGAPEQAVDTFAEFTRNIFQVLHNTDRFAHKHSIKFSAQSDDWSGAWPQLSSMPSTNFTAKHDALTDYPPMPLSGEEESMAFGNRSPHAIFPALDQSRTHTASRGSAFDQELGFRYGASVSSFRKGMMNLAREYLNSNPGRGSLAPNTGVNNKLENLLDMKRTHRVTHEDLKKLEPIVLYRLGLMGEATRYLSEAGVPLPGRQTCAKFDADSYVVYAKKTNDARYHQVYKMVSETRLFTQDHRIKEIGKNFTHKPHIYVVAALNEAYQSFEKMEQKLSEILKVKSAKTQELLREVTKSRAIKDLFSKYLTEIGESVKRYRSVSPSKRSSLSQWDPPTSYRTPERTLTSSLKRLSFGSMTGYAASARDDAGEGRSRRRRTLTGTARGGESHEGSPSKRSERKGRRPPSA